MNHSPRIVIEDDFQEVEGRSFQVRLIRYEGVLHRIDGPAVMVQTNKTRTNRYVIYGAHEPDVVGFQV